MAYAPLFGRPIGENAQENRHRGYLWQHPYDPWWNHNPDRGFRRTAPAEPPYVDCDPWSGKWHQGGWKMPRDFKPKLYWARPVDGKRRGAMGRLKDGLTCEGADVFVVQNADRRTLMRDMPHRAQWSRWKGWLWDANVGQWYWDKDATVAESVHAHMPWARRDGEKYNFYTREYENGRELNDNMLRGRLWTDAHWPDDAKTNDKNPWSFRTSPGMWNTRVGRGAGRFPGGRPRS